jgi:succinate-semialdehyde dehydrogenase/glutarate-semialdehyde dehydrogenase
MIEAVSAPELETVRLKEHGLLLDQGLVGGRWVAADDGATFDVRNPATGGLLARVPRMGVAETRRAISAAADAFPAWRSLLARERAQIIRRWSDLLLAHADELALQHTTEQGNPHAESKAETV